MTTGVEPTTMLPGSTLPGSTLPGSVGLRFHRVLLSEWTKLRSVRSSVYSLGAAVLIVIGLGVLFSAATASHFAMEGRVERATFNPIGPSLAGTFLAQLAVGVLGVLLVSGEYATGMIRASLTAVPTRLPVLWSKAIVFAVVTMMTMTVSTLVAFEVGQTFLNAKHIGTTLSAPGATRSVIGAALYLTAVGVLGVALGALLRNTGGAVATLFGVLLILPILAQFLPSTWATHINRYLPSNAGMALWSGRLSAHGLSPWTGFAVFCGYVALTLAGAGVLLRRRDA